MTVKELIEKLQKVDGNTIVRVWDAYLDAPSDNVIVSVSESYKDEPVIVWVDSSLHGDHEL